MIPYAPMTAGQPSAAGAFPPTRLSLMEATRSSDAALRRQAYDTLLAAYWKPVYKYVRLCGRLDSTEAEDLVQSFFTAAFEKRFFDRFDPSRARFRTFLRTCLDAFLAKERRDRGRLKRGGGVAHVPLDFHQAEAELAHASTQTTPEELFYREWVRRLFELATERLREACAGAGAYRFELFARHDLAPTDAARPSYRQLADEHGLSVADVTRALGWARRTLRGLVLETLRESCATEEEFRAEARQLLGADRPRR